MTQQLEENLLNELQKWYDQELADRHGDVNQMRSPICGALVICEILEDHYPIEETDYLTDKNQVRTSGRRIQNILHKFRENRKFSSEGGRTTRGTRPAAEHWLRRIETFDKDLKTLPSAARQELAMTLQWWLVARAQDWFNRQHLEIQVDLSRAANQVITDILDKAGTRAGAVAQHLVGAKLTMMYHGDVENHSFTTADIQLNRPGDFYLGSTVFHVTVSPGDGVLEKCSANLRDGLKPILLVSEKSVEGAKVLARNRGIDHLVFIQSIESFVATNLEEKAQFDRQRLVGTTRDLLEEYNRRVDAVELDKSLLIDIPANIRDE